MRFDFIMWISATINNVSVLCNRAGTAVITSTAIISSIAFVRGRRSGVTFRNKQVSKTVRTFIPVSRRGRSSGDSSLAEFLGTAAEPGFMAAVVAVGVYNWLPMSTRVFCMAWLGTEIAPDLPPVVAVSGIISVSDRGVMASVSAVRLSSRVGFVAIPCRCRKSNILQESY